MEEQIKSLAKAYNEELLQIEVMILYLCYLDYKLLLHITLILLIFTYIQLIESKIPF